MVSLSNLIMTRFGKSKYNNIIFKSISILHFFVLSSGSSKEEITAVFALCKEQQ
jgi:hypothetical protein